MLHKRSIFFTLKIKKGVETIAVFRIEKTRDYTVMFNHHLKNTALTLKAKRLLYMILSLPEEWNYITRGLAAICKEGVDARGKALKELGTEGYLVRHQLRGEDGRISDTKYVIHEQSQSRPDMASPDTKIRIWINRIWFCRIRKTAPN